MTASEKKLARKRLSALELAQALGNVSEACRQRGIGHYGDRILNAILTCPQKWCQS